jgi:hypothetical protein
VLSTSIKSSYNNNTTTAKNEEQVNKERDFDVLLQKKISLTVEGFTTKAIELNLKDRTRLSKENALTICNYIIDMKREINPRLSYIKCTIQILSELSRRVATISADNNNQKQFADMMESKDDVLLYLDSCRKLENDDPLHKWIGSYNTKRIILMRFFKWLFYSNVASPNKRNQLSIQQRQPKCIMDIPKLKRKEVSCYKPSDVWSQEDDLLFLKWVTNKRDRYIDSRTTVQSGNL